MTFCVNQEGSGSLCIQTQPCPGNKERRGLLRGLYPPTLSLFPRPFLRRQTGSSVKNKESNSPFFLLGTFPIWYLEVWGDPFQSIQR